jgi:hypothetical protein
MESHCALFEVRAESLYIIYRNIIYTLLVPRHTGEAWVGILQRAMIFQKSGSIGVLSQSYHQASRLRGCPKTNRLVFVMSHRTGSTHRRPDRGQDCIRHWSTLTCWWRVGKRISLHTLEQATATYGTRAKRGTRNDFQWHAGWIEYSNYELIKLNF